MGPGILTYPRADNGLADFHLPILNSYRQRVASLQPQSHPQIHQRKCKSLNLLNQLASPHEQALIYPQIPLLIVSSKVPLGFRKVYWEITRELISFLLVWPFCERARLQGSHFVIPDTMYFQMANMLWPKKAVYLLLLQNNNLPFKTFLHCSITSVWVQKTTKVLEKGLITINFIMHIYDRKDYNLVSFFSLE